MNVINNLRVFKLLCGSPHTSMCNNVFHAAAGPHYFIAWHWIILLSAVHTNDTVTDWMFYSDVLHGSSCKCSNQSHWMCCCQYLPKFKIFSFMPCWGTLHRSHWVSFCGTTVEICSGNLDLFIISGPKVNVNCKATCYSNFFRFGPYLHSHVSSG